MLIFSGSVAAGQTAEIQLPYMPQNLVIRNVNNLETTRIGLQVNGLGTGVVFDVDDNFLLQFTGVQGRLSPFNYNVGGTGLFYNELNFVLTDGVFGKENTVIYVKNKANIAQTLEVYAYSTNKGKRMYSTVQQKIYANSGITVTDFDSLTFELVNNNRYNVTFADGTVQNMDNFEFKNLYRFGVNAGNSDFNFGIINNSTGFVKSINIIPSSDQNIVISKMR